MRSKPEQPTTQSPLPPPPAAAPFTSPPPRGSTPPGVRSAGDGAAGGPAAPGPSFGGAPGGAFGVPPGASGPNTPGPNGAGPNGAGPNGAGPNGAGPNGGGFSGAGGSWGGTGAGPQPGPDHRGFAGADGNNGGWQPGPGHDGTGFAPPGAGDGAVDPFAAPGWQPGPGPADGRSPVTGGPQPPTATPVHAGLPPDRGPRRWPKVLAAIAAVVVLGGLLAGSYALVRRSPSGSPSASTSTGAQSPTSSPTPERSPIDVSARGTDPRPLTVEEVFGDDDLRPDAGRDAVYRVLARDKPLTTCGPAASGKIDDVLTKYECSQVIRATVAAPADGYLATVGIGNLADSDGAQAATDKIKQLGKAGDGAFTALPAPGAKKLASSPTVFTLQPYGHYLLYVVVGRADGKAPQADTTTQQIVTDLVQSYLTGVIDDRREAN